MHGVKSGGKTLYCKHRGLAVKQGEEVIPLLNQYI